MALRIVVFSDSHKNFFALKQIVTAHPEAEAFLHLGDGEREFADLKHLYPETLMQGVRGNCDFGSCQKDMEFLHCMGKKIFFTHGHLFDVKIDTRRLTDFARGVGAQVALFGHTHNPLTGYSDGLYLMNPGSVSMPNSGPPTYGVLDITDAGIVTRVVEIKR